MTTEDLGGRIRQERERAGLTQAQLAAQVEVSPRTIGNWERGEAVPRNALTRLLDALPSLREASGAQGHLTLADRGGIQEPTPSVDESNRVVAAILADPYLLPESKAHFLNQYELLLRVTPSERLPYAAHGKRTTPIDPEEEERIENAAKAAKEANPHSPKGRK